MDSADECALRTQSGQTWRVLSQRLMPAHLSVTLVQTASDLVYNESGRRDWPGGEHVVLRGARNTATHLQTPQATVHSSLVELCWLA
jgi:hypothetical protein